MHAISVGAAFVPNRVSTRAQRLGAQERPGLAARALDTLTAMVDLDASRSRVPVGVRLAADLRWLSTAPALMSAEFWASSGVKLASVRVHPNALCAAKPALAPRQVGRWFERVHKVALDGDTGVELLACNRALHADGGTVGELDALFTRSGQVVHREIAVKFYLGVGNTDTLAGWVGPSRRDRLDLKLRRLVQHQLRTPQLAQARGAWPAEYPLPDVREALLVGALFDHGTRGSRPPGANPQLAIGSWWTASEFDSHIARADWRVLERPWWLSTWHANVAPTCSRAALRQLSRPVFLGTPAGTRTFVMPDGWCNA